jgi:hypothetical protein
MVYNELGRHPLHIQRFVRIIKYWLKVLNTDNCIVHEMYRYQYRNLQHNNWATTVKSLLNNIGLSCVWCNQHVTNERAFIADVTERIKCVFLQENCNIMNSSNKCYIYRYLTDNVCLQFYLCNNFDRTIRAALCKIRCSAHILLIETGRYTNQPRNMRLCTVCSSSEVEDEFNFLLKCDC